MRVVVVPSLARSTRRQGPSTQKAHGSREQRPARCGIYEFSDAYSSGFMSSEDEFRLRLCWGQRPWRGLWTCWTVCKVRSHPWQGKDDQQMSRYFDLFFFNVKWCNTTFCWNILPPSQNKCSFRSWAQKLRKSKIVESAYETRRGRGGER